MFPFSKDWKPAPAVFPELGKNKASGFQALEKFTAKIPSLGKMERLPPGAFSPACPEVTLHPNPKRRRDTPPSSLEGAVSLRRCVFMGKQAKETPRSWRGVLVCLVIRMLWDNDAT